MNDSHARDLTQWQILWFWTPLAAMWALMALEQPIVSAFIARLPAPEMNLAAFGIAISMALVFEGPIVQLMAAGTALASGRQPFMRLQSFMHIMAVLLTLVHVLVAVTPAFAVIVQRLIGAPADLVEPSRRCFLIMAPWTAFIGYRRLWQGILIRNGKTGTLPISIVVRLAVMLGVLLTGMRMSSITGASLGGLSLTLGVIVNAVVVYLYLRPVLKTAYRKVDGEGTGHRERELSWRALLKFYLPLSATTFITLVVRPVLSMALARAAYPRESLAAFPVVFSTMILFFLIALSYQEAVITLLGGGNTYSQLRRFAITLSGGITVLFLIFALSPLKDIWFAQVLGLPPGLLPFTLVPLLILSLAPALIAVIVWYRGVLISRNRTTVVMKAVGINAVTLTTTVLVGIALLPVAGIIIASLAFVVSMVVELAYLIYRTNRRPRER